MNDQPTLSTFDPSIIAWQDDVIDYIDNIDWDKGVHEILLSGSLGCLREDVLIETSDGPVPISRITKQHYLLSFDHRNNQFCFVQGSDAFPKGKGYLYRVTTTHGEFVASGNHHIATSDGSYLSVENLYGSAQHWSCLSFLDWKNPLADRKSFLSNVLHSWHKVSNFLHHCAERIRQCDPQLRQELDSVLNAFPLSSDALRFGQFFYSSKYEHLDGVQELALKYGHIFELFSPQSMRDFVRLLENKPAALEDVDSYSKLFAQSFDDIQLLWLSDQSIFHPKVLLFFLAKYCTALLEISTPYSCIISNGAILSIEKLDKQEWYWDIQVPNTNNYISNGMIHHNSAKSTLLAHLIVKHCFSLKGANVLIGRRALPDLKRTLYDKIIEHMDQENIVEGRDYTTQETTGYIYFPRTKSQIFAGSWADNRFKKFRSLELSMAVFEELTENDDAAAEAYHEISMRVGRLNHIKEKLIISATNPDGKSHWVYKHFISSDSANRKVFYSVTEDNPFLPKSYIEKIKSDLDPKMAERMLYGKWIDISQEVIYHAYNKSRNYKPIAYEVNIYADIHISWDFNIALGKPLSLCLFQFIDGVIHVFSEVVIDGADTDQSCQEIAALGWLDIPDMKYCLHGDATGKARSSASKRSNYDVIESFFANYRTKLGSKVDYDLEVPLSNPPIRERHNLVNAYCLNSKNEVRLLVYKDAPTVDEGLRLTALKKGGSFIEDDSKRFQHVTTSLGYGLHWVHKNISQKPSVARTRIR